MDVAKVRSRPTAEYEEQEVERKIVKEKPEPPQPDMRHKSCWPLPGGREKYIPRLLAILEQIRRAHPSLDDLAEWASEQFGAGDWMKGAIDRCVLYPGLASNPDELSLTPTGSRYLETRDPDIVVEGFAKNILGFKEMLTWLGEKPMSKDELLNAFNKLGAGWKKIDQVTHRLNWLMALGWVSEQKHTRPREYALSRS